jgi:tetratricopeptide (TPR) repeat protein
MTNNPICCFFSRLLPYPPVQRLFRIFLFATMTFCLSTSSTAQELDSIVPETSVPLLLIASPIDAGRARDRKKNLWLYALMDASVRFRFDHCTSFQTVPWEKLAQYRSPVRTGKEKQDIDYWPFINEHRVTHLLQNKFKIDYRRKTFTLDLQIVDCDHRSTIVGINITGDLDDMGYLVDSCFFAGVRALAGEHLSPEEVRFFVTPALCVQYRNNKKTGEIAYKESYAGHGAMRQNTDNYGKILSMEKNPLFCVWQQGKAALREGRYNLALSNFRQLYKMLPENTSCGIAIAEASLGKKDPQTAKYKLNTILMIRHPPPPRVYGLMGDAFLLSRDTSAALDYYRKERSLHGNTPALQAKIAATAFALHAPAEAEPEYDSLIAMEKNNDRARYYLAYIKLKLGKEKEGGDLLAEAKKRDKGTAFLWEPIGDCYAATRRWQKATDAYQNAHRLDPREPRILLKLSDTHCNAGNDSLGARYLMLHFELDRKSNIESASKAGYLFIKIKAWSQAADAFAAYLDEGSTDYDATLAYAQIMYAQKKWKKVIDLLKIHSGSTSATEEVLLMLTKAWYETGEYLAAKPVLMSLYSMNPQNLDIVLLTARTAEKTGDLTKAATMYEKALMFPNIGDAQNIAFHIAGIYEKLKQPTRAIERYEINIGRYPSDTRNYDRLIDLYTKYRQKQRLKYVLEKAINNVTMPASTNLLLARTYSALGEHSRAIVMFQTYLAREPKDAEAWRDLGALYISQQQYDNAITPLKKAAAKMSRDFDCQSMLGICYLKKNDHRSAVSPLERAHRSKRKDTGTIERLASCYRSLNDGNRLFALLKRWIDLDRKRSDIRVEFGLLLIDRKKSREAIEVLTEALRLDPSNGKARQLLAAAKKLEQTDSAKKRPKKNKTK